MDKDRFDSLMQMVEFARRNRDSRRGIEWQLSFALWAMLGAAAVAIKGLPQISLIIGAVIVVVLHGWWVGWNCLRANTEARAMYRYASFAEAELSDLPPHFDIRGSPHRLGFIWHPPSLLAWLTTMGMTAGTIVVINGHH